VKLYRIISDVPSEGQPYAMPSMIAPQAEASATEDSGTPGTCAGETSQFIRASRPLKAMHRQLITTRRWSAGLYLERRTSLTLQLLHRGRTKPAGALHRRLNRRACLPSASRQMVRPSMVVQDRALRTTAVCC
jgi:hypothetical protein